MVSKPSFRVCLCMQPDFSGLKYASLIPLLSDICAIYSQRVECIYEKIYTLSQETQTRSRLMLS